MEVFESSGLRGASKEAVRKVESLFVSKHAEAVRADAECEVEVIESDDAEVAEVKLQFDPELLHDEMSDEDKDRAKRSLLRYAWKVLTAAYGGSDYPPVVEPYRPKR